MPKIQGFTHKQKIAHRQELITKRCKGLMAEKGITQRQLAAALEMTDIAISRQFKNGKITFPVFLEILELTGEDAESSDKEKGLHEAGLL